MIFTQHSVFTLLKHSETLYQQPYYRNVFHLYLMIGIYRGWRNNVLVSYAPICYYVNIIICSSCTKGLPKGPMASWVILHSKEQIMKISFKNVSLPLKMLTKILIFRNLDLRLYAVDGGWSTSIHCRKDLH